MAASNLLQLFADPAIDGERQLLAGGDHVAAALEQRLQLRRDLAQPRAGGVADHLRPSFHLRRHLHPDVAAQADDLADVAADFFRIDVHCGDELHPRF